MGGPTYTQEERQWLQDAAARPRLTKQWIKETWPFPPRSIDGLYNWINNYKRGHKASEQDSPLQSLATADYSEAGEEASWTATGLREAVRSLDDLYRVSDVDAERWECASWQAKAYQGYIKTDSGEIETVQLHSVSARFKPRRGLNWRKELATLVEEFNVPYLAHCPPKSHTTHHKRLLEISIPDLHAGKLAWGEECGADYDTKIALEIHRQAVMSLIESSAHWGPTECLYVVGNDLFNADNSQNTTTKGTPQDVDTRHQKVFQMVSREIISTIRDLLSPRFEHIHVVIVPGNHDSQTAWFLGEVLAAWFRNASGVTVSNPSAHRKYHHFGKCLIGFAHGDNEKIADLPTLMATERPQEYAASLYREFHCGHIHRQKQVKFTDVWEERGCIVRFLSSLCASDAWHSSKGYSMQRRQAEALVWDADAGLVGMAVASLESLLKQAA